MLSDEELYNRFYRDRSEEAVRMLVERHRDSLVLFINSFVHNMDVALELTVDTFAEVSAGPTGFSGRSSFKTWLFSVGRNLALKYIRKSRFSVLSPKAIPIEELDEYPGTGDTESPELKALKDERNSQLYQALSKLNDEYRLVLILLFFEGMSKEEAALVMGKSKKQIYNLTERGKNALKEELLKMGFEYEIGL